MALLTTRLRVSAATLGLAAVLAPAFLAAQETHVNNLTGVWKMNLSRSDLGGAARPQSEQMAFQPDGTLVVTIQLAGGKTLSFSRPWSGGKEVPISGTPEPSATMVSKIRGGTLTDTWRVNGNILRTARGKLSRDGKMLTLVVDGKDDQGKAEHRIEVFEKQ